MAPGTTLFLRGSLVDSGHDMPGLQSSLNQLTGFHVTWYEHHFLISYHQ
jgi:hypothetical protein